MALSAEDHKVITAVFGEDKANEISGAIPQELTLGLRLNGKILSIEDQQTMKSESVKQGRELFAKDIAKQLEVTLEAGEKDPTIIAEKFKLNLSTVFEEKYKNQTPTDEQIALAKKASEFEDKYKTLFKTHTDTEKLVGEWQGKYTQQEKAIQEEKINNKILASLPEKMVQDRNDALLIARNNFVFELDETGQYVAKLNGIVEKNSLGEPESIDNVIKAFVEKKGWIKAAGMGGSDRNGGGNNNPKGMTPDQARAFVIAKGIAPASPEGLKLFGELIKK